MKKVLLALTLTGIASLAFAKLPPLSPEAKAKADEAAAKTAWSGKVDTYLMCKAQDKVAVQYFKSAKAASTGAKPPANAPACADPGPFAYTPDAQKPLETSGAHSPAGNAVSPPSTRQPDAVGNPDKKP
jgi:hypothetical protein